MAVTDGRLVRYPEQLLRAFIFVSISLGLAASPRPKRGQGRRRRRCGARRGAAAASIEICGVAESRRCLCRRLCRPQRGKNYVLTRFAT